MMCSVLNLELKLKSAYASTSKSGWLWASTRFHLERNDAFAFASTTAGIVIAHLLILQLNCKLSH
jgi:hypothetical protein